jgi:hypothetical protein
VAEVFNLRFCFKLISAIVENGTSNFPTLLAQSSNKGYGFESPYNILGAEQITSSISATNTDLTNISGSYITIGSEGLPVGGGVVVAAGSNNPNSFAQFGSHSLPYGYIRAVNLEVNTYGGGNTNIGTTDSGTTTFYRPLSIGYGPPSLNNWNQIG